MTTISRENNFDVIRLLAALQVTIGHGLHILQIEGGGFLTWCNPFPGVIIFFTISGFLITMSWERSKTVEKYARNRFLRLFPALFVCFIITQLLLVFFGYINLQSFLNPQMWVYWIGQLTLFQFFTPDALRGFGCGCPNGSLWTIPVEIEFYLLIPLILIMMGKKFSTNTKIYLFAGLSILYNSIVFFWLPNTMGAHKTSAAGLVAQIMSGDITPLVKVVNVTCVPYLYCFLFGAWAYKNWDRVHWVFEGRFIFWIVGYLVLCFGFGLRPGYYIDSFQVLFMNLLLAGITLSAAFSYTKYYNILRGNDISYGIYIFHGVVLNVFVELGFMHKLQYYFYAIGIAIVLAILSWTLIEKKALSKK